MTDIQFFDKPEVQLINVQASDVMAAQAAWVSTKGEKSQEIDHNRVKGLINYLIRDRHGSVFEHSQFTFFVKTPLFVRSEFHRHRAGWSYNELSGRYSEMLPHFYLPNGERNLTQTGKPGAYIFAPGTSDQYGCVESAVEGASRYAWEQYQTMLNEGIAKEVARMVLPLNTMTSFYATCNPRSLMHFLGLRTKSDEAAFPSFPQFEINQVASLMEEHFKEHMPITWEAWNRNGRVAP